MQTVAARAQTSTGSIEGFVRDSTNRRLDRAEITILGRADRSQPVVSDSAGHFRIASASTGEVRLSVRRIGYWAKTLTVVVAANSASQIEIVLAESPTRLEPELIVADPTRGKMGAFNRRMARGIGSFVTRTDIEKRQPASISELLRTLPGVHISQRMAGEPQPVDMQRSRNSSMQASCVVQLYVDGQPYPHGDIDDFPPLSVEGVEVYRSASEIPADFRTRNATCGLIALWTRDPEAARRKP
jgi:hypothetical protein